MGSILLFVGGIIVGVVYEKAIRGYTHKFEKAAKAAQNEFKN